MDKSTMWKFGTREIVYSAIGAALYGVLNWVFNNLQLPGTTLVSFRPPVAIPFFMGFIFGPWVGLFTGFVGNVIGDLLSGYGFFWAWDVGNGLMGFIPGLWPMLMPGMEFKTPRGYGMAALTAGSTMSGARPKECSTIAFVLPVSGGTTEPSTTPVILARSTEPRPVRRIT